MTSHKAFAPRLALLFAALVLAGCASTSLPLPPVADSQPKVAVMEAPAPTSDVAIEPPSAANAVTPVPSTDTGPAVGTPVDPLRPESIVFPEDPGAHTDLWARVRRGFAVPNLEDDYVRRQEQWYASRPDYVARMTGRSSRFLFHIVEEVHKRGLPTELALLPFIESAFNPEAMSVAKASGMWQFIPSTGKDFDLKQNFFRDDRRSVLASTRAALDYLTRLHGMFGDWHLALAAYNWGEGNVQRAIARNQRAGKPTDYSSLRMPDETRNYVPKLQAVKNIVSRPEAFGLTLPELSNHPYFLTVPIERDIDVALAAKLAGMSEEDFKQLNPQMNKPVILAAGTPEVLLPYDNANAFVRNLGQYKGPLASWTAWITNKTVKPADAAKQVGMSEARLVELNRIPPRMLIKAGSVLLVPRSEHAKADVPETLADNAMMVLAPEPKQKPLRRVVVKAGKKGDSVAAVARRYGVSVEQVAEWNKVATGATFKPGQSIVVFRVNEGRTRKPAASAASRSSRPKAARAAAGRTRTHIQATRRR